MYACDTFWIDRDEPLTLAMKWATNKRQLVEATRCSAPVLEPEPASLALDGYFNPRSEGAFPERGTRNGYPA
ncbi:Uncharacterised protein [Mycobacteroides abscessus subsp. abscessus]|nr:Uncharacterised protein [Mycobacteroides abscessus subsp. abscessus]